MTDTNHMFIQDNGAVDDGGPRYPTRSFRRGYGGGGGRGRVG